MESFFEFIVKYLFLHADDGFEDLEIFPEISSDETQLEIPVPSEDQSQCSLN